MLRRKNKNFLPSKETGQSRVSHEMGGAALASIMFEATTPEEVKIAAEYVRSNLDIVLEMIKQNASSDSLRSGIDYTIHNPPNTYRQLSVRENFVENRSLHKNPDGTLKDDTIRGRSVALSGVRYTIPEVYGVDGKTYMNTKDSVQFAFMDDGSILRKVEDGPNSQFDEGFLDISKGNPATTMTALRAFADGLKFHQDNP